MDPYPGCEHIDPGGLTVSKARNILAEHDDHEPSKCEVRIQMRMWLVHQK
jgi:hypothetical protein